LVLVLVDVPILEIIYELLTAGLGDGETEIVGAWSWGNDSFDFYM
jgi:hypothetical protein